MEGCLSLWLRVFSLGDYTPGSRLRPRPCSRTTGLFSDHGWGLAGDSVSVLPVEVPAQVVVRAAVTVAP